MLIEQPSAPQLANPGELRHSAPLFAALGERSRLRLVIQLAALGEQSIAQLAARSALTRQAIRKHLAILEAAGLVKGTAAGRERRYQLESPQLALAMSCLDQICRHASNASR